MEEKIMRLLAEACGVEREELEPDIDMFEEGLLDSFGMISFLVSLESVLSIKIEPTEIERDEIKTPALFLGYVMKRC
jgi:D-alanine--poly(phosphoribitol) ligase subunit 2